MAPQPTGTWKRGARQQFVNNLLIKFTIRRSYTVPVCPATRPPSGGTGKRRVSLIDGCIAENDRADWCARCMASGRSELLSVCSSELWNNRASVMIRSTVVIIIIFVHQINGRYVYKKCNKSPNLTKKTIMQYRVIHKATRTLGTIEIFTVKQPCKIYNKTNVAWYHSVLPNQPCYFY